jgi:hypothetical protein
VKGKDILVTGRGGPYGCERFKAPTLISEKFKNLKVI